MSLQSFGFFGFLLVVAVVYLHLPQRLQSVFLLGASWVFYALAALAMPSTPSMLPVSRLVFAESDAEADEFYSAACTALAHGVGTCRALLHNG